MADEQFYLTVREVAGLLRLKERRVYALARAGTLPGARATGRLLFRRDAVLAWLAARDGRAAAVPGAGPAVLVGSHDPLLEWALRESGSAIASFLDGSLDGLARLARGEAAAAGLHLPPEDGRGDWNSAQVEERLAGRAVVLLEWAWRERGLIVASGNPLGLDGLAAAARHRLARRQPEAGSQILLERLLAAEGLACPDPGAPGAVARSEADAALLVADGKADAAFGLICLARQFRLGFVPVTRERFDLAVDRRAYFEPPLQRFLAFCRSPALPSRAHDLGGYDLSGLFRVHYNAP
jgi:excisionase family DNA binding protein